MIFEQIESAKRQDCHRVGSEDLFKKLFDKFSDTSFIEYEKSYLCKLPLRLLNYAATVNPKIIDDDYLLLKDALMTDNSYWRNPEIYPYLNYLCRSDNPEPGLSLKCLRIHLSEEDFCGSFPISVKYLRLWYPANRVYQFINGTAVPSPGLVHSKSSNLPVIYVPKCDLFSDISSTLYRGEGAYHESLHEFQRNFESALTLITDFCPDLSRRILRRISSIGFMTRRTHAPKSFSVRNHFIGGIFVSMAAAAEVAEQIMHEYYHQQIWPWWLVQRPSDLPEDSTKIVSPVTGNSRGIAVMIQALLIYISIARFYEFLLRSPVRIDSENVDRAMRRLEHIDMAIPKLFMLLRYSLKDVPKTLAQLEFINGMRNEPGRSS